MRGVLRSVVVAMLSIALIAGVGQAEEPAPLKKFMQAKLEHSQKLLAALTTEDFEAMAKQSQELSLLTLAEEWSVLHTVEYDQHSREFRRAANALTEAAKKKNLDGAAFAYVDLTMKCVNCHKYLKQHRTAEVALPRFTR